ncbi:copine-3-like [Ruditapes philippinarum]|uniref:copine-3-like n=1 Tax=Ruditapes philippinarum TaxID=129788 RepID=UPI00295A690C|nr:copine-3-like [Ruditapes philippinarum]
MATSGMASRPMSKVELRISCRKLLNKDITSKSDPCAVLFVNQGSQWIEHGRTENVQNNLDPDFSKAFSIDYMFEEVQKVKVAVYDLDNDTPQLGDDDFLGQVECTLGQIVAASPFQKQLVLKNGKPAGEGKIIIRSEEVKEGGEIAICTFKARKLDNKDFLGKSDPYLEILRGNPDGSWQVVHRTEVVKNNLNPHWRQFTIPVHTLCGGDKTKPVKFDVYDWDSDGSHDLIGGFTVSVKDLEASNGKEFPCINEKKKAKKKKYDNSGFVVVDSFKLKKVASFLEFIYGGMQINFTVGVDFTGSNGDPTHPRSLHYINPYQPNEYMQAIQAVGMVCQDYDTDKMFPALGFGAKIPPDNKVSHEFAMNFNPQNPFCAGIQGIVQAYQNCIPQIQLWGPTNVAPIIHHVAKFAAAAQTEEATKGAHAYFVLLLLTDGVITDMDDTRSAIVQASALPMSLIIVGVGEADFTDMQMLDGDDGVLKAPNGQPVYRDIVQFVPFRDFKTSSAAELAKHVLAEVPQQVTQYYEWRKIQPNQPRPQNT